MYLSEHQVLVWEKSRTSVILYVTKTDGFFF